MHPLLQDLKYALRIHTKSPALTVAAALTLALGIGASAGVFNVLNAVLLKPLPYPHAERIAIPWRLAPAGLNLGYEEIPWGLRGFKRMSNDSRSFECVGAFKSDTFNLTGAGEPALLEGLRASAGFFSSLGVLPAIGRTFTPAEDRPGYEHEVVLSHHLWLDRFGGDRAALGKTIDLNGDPYTVIGVMPAGFVFPRAEEMPGSFDFPRQADLWVPLALPAAAPPNAPSELALIGRFRPGVTLISAQQEMQALTKSLENETPEGKGWFNIRLTPLPRQVAGNTRDPLLLMLGAVGVMLLITCSNVANLLLARSLGRRTEFALRHALGAAKDRLIRQLLTESLLLAATGGLLGILFVEASVHFVKVFGPSSIPRLREVSLDARVLAFTLAVTLACGILCGLAPAIGSIRREMAGALKEGRGASGNAAGQTTRKVLLVSQVALSLVLLIASVLLVKSFLRLIRVQPGFNAERVLTFELSLPDSKYTHVDQIVALYRRALESFRSIPGVRSAGIVETVPMDGSADASLIRIPDRPVPSGQEPLANYNIASPGYFSAVGTPVLRGRDFAETDTAQSTPVTVISSAMANKFWPGQNPIGKQVGLLSRNYPLMTIIGIVADVKHLSLREAAGPEMYVPYTQKVFPSMSIMHVVLRTRTDPASLVHSVHEAVASLDPELPVAKVTTLATLVNNSMAGQRFAMLLLAMFGALSLLLACIGMYGVISFFSLERRREIGIRLALGATRANVFAKILGQGARLAMLGVALGLAVAVAVTRLMASALYGVDAIDPFTFGGVSLLLMGVALLACYLPARRATRIAPMSALRF
jgi:predicted permease